MAILGRDVFYRPNVILLQLPILREIREDIQVLAEHFLMKLHGRVPSSVSKIVLQVIEIFDSYGWPGNVCELTNVVERAVALCEGSMIKPGHLLTSIVRLQQTLFPKLPGWRLQENLLPPAAQLLFPCC